MHALAVFSYGTLFSSSLELLKLSRVCISLHFYFNYDQASVILTALYSCEGFFSQLEMIPIVDVLPLDTSYFVIFWFNLQLMSKAKDICQNVWTYRNIGLEVYTQPNSGTCRRVWSSNR